jgi:hypothetical protein
MIDGRNPKECPHGVKIEAGKPLLCLECDRVIRGDDIFHRGRIGTPNPAVLRGASADEIASAALPGEVIREPEETYAQRKFGGRGQKKQRRTMVTAQAENSAISKLSKITSAPTWKQIIAEIKAAIAAGIPIASAILTAVIQILALFGDQFPISPAELAVIIAILQGLFPAPAPTS